MRRLLVALLLVCAPAAQAAPQPLRVVHGYPQVALAGHTVLFTELSRDTLRVKAMPVSGGPARTVFTQRGSYGLLEASAQRAVVIVARPWQAFSGPPGGPFTALAPARDDAELGAQVDGDRVFLRAGADYTAYDPLAHAAFAGDRAAFAGDLVAHAQRLPGDDPPDLPSGVQVRNWRTGALVSETRFPTEIDAIALRSDGRAMVSASGILYELLPGGKPRRISEGSEPRMAGERTVYVKGYSLRIAEPGAGSRAFGAPTRSLRGFAADERHVAWVANDCLLVAAVGDPAVKAIGPGPCARSELEFSPGSYARCVAAPNGVCRGRLRSRTYRIAVGHSRKVPKGVRWRD